MSKTLERIQAFIRLANNNPNEHEANAAARKACKMISENNINLSEGLKRTTTPDFKSTRPEQQTTQRPVTRPAYNSYTNPTGRSGSWFYNRYYNDGQTRYREAYWKDVEDRQKEAYNKQEHKTEYYEEAKPFTDDIIEALLKRMRETRNNPFNFTGSWTTERPSNASHHPSDDAYYSRRKERGFGDDVRTLLCKICKQHKDTKFVGLAEAFECNDCQWTAYERDKKE